MSVGDTWHGADNRQREISRGTTQLGAIWRRFRKQRGGLVGIVVLILILVGIIIVPIVLPLPAVGRPEPGRGYIPAVNPNPDMWWAPAATTDPATGYTYWLGSDKLGRDVLKRVFVAGRISLPTALIAAFLTTMLGTAIGLIAGYFGGWLDTAIMRVTDFVLAWPLIPAYVVFYRVIRGSAPSDVYRDDPLPLFTFIILTFLLFSWMGVARLVRINVLVLRKQPFVEATRALGAGDARIMLKHILPNVLAPVLVAGTVMVGEFILFEALLSFFGLGLSEPPGPSWGTLLAFGQSQIWAISNPNPFESIRFYLFLLPCLMILITVLSINSIAEALRSAMTIRQG